MKRRLERSFEDLPVKELPIPMIIDGYNHNMNGIGLANQYRESCETHRTTYLILSWILDTAVIDAYKLQYLYMKQQGVSASKIYTNETALINITDEGIHRARDKG
ncbi:hypothetical protein PABG_11037 [Paracoccidioides brasiliensis Pb03]|nr:hypothetical protein PABG_11037 [Paracoccidioides brasiliensis Pb03]